MDQQFAARFAAEWICAWNAHDLDGVLAHYADDFEMSSPFISQIAGEPSGRLRGKTAVRAYWEGALALYPTLRFELVAVLSGVDSITLCYKSVNGRLAAEVFFFDLRGLVASASAHYAF